MKMRDCPSECGTVDTYAHGMSVGIAVGIAVSGISRLVRVVSD